MVMGPLFGVCPYHQTLPYNCKKKRKQENKNKIKIESNVYLIHFENEKKRNNYSYKSISHSLTNS
jgi:hypothetical protein